MKRFNKRLEKQQQKLNQKVQENQQNEDAEQELGIQRLVSETKDDSAPSRPNEVEDEDASNEICENCKRRTIRKNEAEGTLVCLNCGLVAAFRLPASGQKEKVFTDAQGGTNQATVARTGQQMNIPQINRMGLVYGNEQNNKKRRQNNGNQVREIEDRDETNKKESQKEKELEEYLKLANQMRQKHKFRTNVIDMFKQKIEQFIHEKHHGSRELHLKSGKKKAYAACILHHILKENGYQIKLHKIMKSQNLTKDDLVDVTKKLQKVFKEWFYKRAQDMMPKYCEKLGYSDELKQIAQHVIDKIHSEGWIEGVQPLTEVGVALFTLNKRLEDIQKQINNKAFVVDKRVAALLHERKDPFDIAKVVEKGLAAIREKYERIQDHELDIFPDYLLYDREKKQKMRALDIQGVPSQNPMPNRDRYVQQQHPAQRQQHVQQGMMPPQQQHHQQQQQYRGAPQQTPQYPAQNQAWQNLGGMYDHQYQQHS